MASNKTNNTAAKAATAPVYPTTPLAQIHALKGTNPSRCDNQPLFADDKDLRRLTNKMMRGFNVAVGNTGITPMTDVEIATGVEERTEQWDALKDSTAAFEITESLSGKKITVSASDMLRTFEGIYTKGGKVIAPKYAVVWAFRRNTVALYTAAVRDRMEESLDPVVNIPAVIRVYANPGDRALDALRENENKKDGFRELSWADKVHGARIMHRDSMPEIRFREVWAVGTAQKLFAFCKLDKRYPEIGMYDKVMAGTLDLSSLDKEELRKLANPTEAEVDQNAVELFLNDPTVKAKTPMTSKKDLKAIGDQCPVVLIAKIVKAILANEAQTVIRQYVANFEAINAGVDAAMAPQPEAELSADKEELAS